MLFGGTALPNSVLFGGTVPQNIIPHEFLKSTSYFLYKVVLKRLSHFVNTLNVSLYDDVMKRCKKT